MSEHQIIHKHYRSFFWPIMLIGAGVIWLLSNLNIVPTENLWILFRLWPVLIIIAGLDVLFANRLPVIGALLGLLVIAGVVYILFMGANLGIETAPKPKTEIFTVEVGNTTTADFDLNLSVQATTIHSLTDPANLVTAEIGHLGEVKFIVAGREEKEIDLKQVGIEAWYAWFLPEVEGEDLVWDIGLSPKVPFDLDVEASTGHSELDLADIKLERFQFAGSTGASTIILPASSEGYESQIEASTGALEIILPSESDLTIRLDASTGRVVFDVPEGAAVQVEVRDGGSGDLLTPSWITKVSGKEGRDEGVYQTEGFENAKYQLVIIIEDIGTGNIVIE
jgi:hypothetical protein